MNSGNGSASRRVVAALVVGVFFSIMRPGQAAAADPCSALHPKLAGSLTRGIPGNWRSIRDTSRIITMQPMDSGKSLVAVSTFGFRAVGFLDCVDFVGLVQPDSVPQHPTIRTRGVLRLRWVDPDRVEVEFAEDLSGAVAATDVWDRSDMSAPSGAPVAAAVTGEVRLPGPDDYVYVETLPEPLERVAPAYPDWARAKSISGTVIVKALVGKSGRVMATRIHTSIPELDDHALAAVKQWRFKPAAVKGEPVAVWVAVPVKFTLR